jgi:CheY-like chemotaxis protein
VDDIETNLYVASGLLSPYRLEIETADSGFAAIAMIQDGRTYDIIFMDHMMPQMDGIETTQKLRELGYRGTIIALTANAMAANEKLFRQNGFDGFISKPIEPRKLNSVLERYVRDCHPEEAEKYRKEAEEQALETAKSPKLLAVFRRDAEKAVATLRRTLSDDDMKLFTTTVHAMKSALANIGELEASRLAFALEQAGLDGDRKFIAAHTENFVKTLEALIQILTEPLHEDAGDIEEDTAILKEQLLIVKAACENYDDAAAYAALDRLKEKPWKSETGAALENIRDMLFLHSDFEGAGAEAEKWAK